MDRILPESYAGAFKDADIRGITGSELDDDLAYAIARAFVIEFGYTTLVVGRDVRISSPRLAEAFMAGARDVGANVIDLGLVHSPMLYFASGSLNVPGVMITASHSPAAYNGFKLVAPGAVPLTKRTGLQAILRRIKRGDLGTTARTRGKRSVKNIRPAYQRRILKGLKPQSCDGLRIAADIGNGMASIMLPLLTEKLPISFETLFADLDGTSPHRGSDPTIRKHQKQLVKLLQGEDFDFGIGFDGDADRIAFLDETGGYVNSAVIGALIAERILKKEPGSAHVFTNMTSRIYEESVKAAGGKPVRSRVGHAFLKRKMREIEAPFGCEHSGHFFFRDFYFTDSVVLTLRYVLEAYTEAKAEGMSFSEMVRPYQRYQQLEDTVIEVADKTAVIHATEAFIQEQFPTAKVKRFDGLFVSTDEAWGAVKPSVTEHAVKVMFEGQKKAAATAMQKELVAFIKQTAAASHSS